MTEADTEGPVTEGTARDLVKGVNRFKKLFYAVAAVAVIALAAAGFSYKAYTDGTHSRCVSGNELRTAIATAGQDTSYTDEVLAAFGIKADATQQDVESLPPDEQQQAKQLLDKLRLAKQHQIDKYNKPAFKARKC